MTIDEAADPRAARNFCPRRHTKRLQYNKKKAYGGFEQALCGDPRIQTGVRGDVWTGLSPSSRCSASGRQRGLDD